MTVTVAAERVYYRCIGVHGREYLCGDSLPRWYWECLTADEREELLMGFFDRARKTDEQSKTSSALNDEASKKHYPTVVEVLTTQMDGQFGQTSRCSLSVFVQEGLWKAIVRDKAEGLCLWVTAPTLQALFKAVENGLADPEAVWRLDRFAGHQQASRKKK